MYTIKEIFGCLNAAFPFSKAESWDNAGILVDMYRPVSKILVALDASIPVIEEAEKTGAELIISHHPVIFDPIKALSLKHPAVMALKKGIGIISAHTNFDIGYLSADSHFSELLANSLSFREEGILDVTHTDPHPLGFGRVGHLSKSMTSQEFAVALKNAAGCDSLRFVPTDKSIRRIAFCCGGGAEYLEKAIEMGLDAYITSDVKHNHFTDAINAGIALFAPTHYQMERPAMKSLLPLLKQSFPDAEIILSEYDREPTQVI